MPVPKFDPSKPFTRDEPKFDPTKPFESGDHSVEEKATAAVEGFGNSLSAGFLPKIQALYGASLRDPSADIDEQLRAKGTKISQPEWNSYEAQKQMFEDKRAKMATEMPEQFYGGEVAGTLVGSGMGVAGAAKGLSAGAKGLIKLGAINAAKKAIPHAGTAAAAYHIYKNLTKD